MTSSAFTQYVQDLKKLIRESGAYDRKLKWLFLNTLWHEPPFRERFSHILKGYLVGVTTWTPKHVLLLVESAASTFALVPFMGGITDAAGCKLAIWREVLPVGLSASWLLPSRLDKELSCVIVQDVVAKGSVLRRVAEDIKTVGWRVELFVAIVRDTSNETHFEQNVAYFRQTANCSADFRSIHLLDWSEIA